MVGVQTYYTYRTRSSTSTSVNHPGTRTMSIEYTLEGGVGVVTLSRPEKKNAMLLAMRDRLAELCEHINDSPEVRAVVLTGAGTDFCADADIGEMGMGGLNGSFLRARHMHKAIRALARV